jgi:rhomboid protease GluP
VLIPSLIPIAVSRSGQHIDYAAHLGGALIGIAVGLVVLKTWRDASPVPRFTAFAAGVCLAGAAVIALAIVPLHRNYAGYELETFLIPPDQLPKSNADGKTRSADLVARYPRDPRARLMRAAALLDDRDPAGAERELRAGLKEDEILKTKFQPDLEVRLRTVLAAVLVDKGQNAEAKAIARPACGAAGSMREMLDTLKVCE